MGLERFYELVKEAKAINKLPEPPKIKPIASLAEPPKAPKIPKVEKIPELKLDNGLGKMKPPKQPEFKTNSPYNER